jgi:hypothetical protein
MKLTSHRQVECTESISREGISSTLKNNGRRSVPFHDLRDDLQAKSGSVPVSLRNGLEELTGSKTLL